MTRFFWLSVAVLCAVCTLGCGGPPETAGEPGQPQAPPAAPRPLPALGPGPHLGLDVSHHSGAIDWSVVVQQGFAFVYVKASEGVDDPDPLFGEHWRTLAELGIHRGAYHFYVTEDDPEEQARLFLSTAKLRHGDLAPVVDVEVIGKGTAEGWQEDLLRFLEILEEDLGVRPILYTSPHFWNANVHESFRRYPLWVAEYGVEEPTVPEGWESWTLWQFEGDVAVPGVEKEVDKSKTHPDLDLETMRIPARLRPAAR